MLSGFKNFILRGNLIELATAFIMATAFAAVVTATVNLLMDLVGKLGGTPDFSAYNWNGISIGDWLTQIVAFVIMAAIVYFGIVAPYTKAKEKYFPAKEEEDAAAPEDVVLLQEIRDLLAAQKPGGSAL